MRESGRLTSNNFFRHLDSEQSDDSVSDLISNTNQVVAGGSLSILRQKTAKVSAVTMKPLSNDITSLIKEFHAETDAFKEVNKLNP